MTLRIPLPVFLPKIPDQRWSCHSCGQCCRTLVGHLFEDERLRLQQQQWSEKLGVAAYVRVGRGWVLNKQEDGACVFLDDQNRCRIHAEYGEQAKPLACRVFPFSLRSVSNGWRADLRFDCPSVLESKGSPIGSHRSLLESLAAKLPHQVARHAESTNLNKRIPATPDEVEALLSRCVRWIRDESLSLSCRLVGFARFATLLNQASFQQVRGCRFVELVDTLMNSMHGEYENRPLETTAKQRAMIRQLAFAHGEYLSLSQRRANWFRRLSTKWGQLRCATRFRRGLGTVPPVVGIPGTATFCDVESCRPAARSIEQIENLIQRYLIGRLKSQTVFGPGYYGWPVTSGLAALALSMAVVGWLARYHCVAGNRTELSLEDVSTALAITDRAVTRLPALGTVTERARVSYLVMDDGLARLVFQNRLVEQQA